MILTFISWYSLSNSISISFLVSISYINSTTQTVVSLDFSFISCFSEKVHVERRPVVLESNLEGWAGSRCSAWESGLLRLLPWWSVTWRANVACEIAVAVISLFKLEVWKTLRKPYPLLNYCNIIDGTRTVENTDYRFNCFTCPVFNKIFKSLKKSKNIHMVSFKQNKNIWTK